MLGIRGDADKGKSCADGRQRREETAVLVLAFLPSPRGATALFCGRHEYERPCVYPRRTIALTAAARQSARALSMLCIQL